MCHYLCISGTAHQQGGFMPEEQGRSSINCEKNNFYYVFTQLENSSAIYDLLYQTNGNAEKKRIQV